MIQLKEQKAALISEILYIVKGAVVTVYNDTCLKIHVQRVKCQRIQKNNLSGIFYAADSACVDFPSNKDTAGCADHRKHLFICGLKLAHHSTEPQVVNNFACGTVKQ